MKEQVLSPRPPHLAFVTIMTCESRWADAAFDADSRSTQRTKAARAEWSEILITVEKRTGHPVLAGDS